MSPDMYRVMITLFTVYIFSLEIYFHTHVLFMVYSLLNEMTFCYFWIVFVFIIWQ